jgi:ubiquitin carboxyl-terminal hydrolase 7
MQFGDEAVSTTELTRSFGWTEADSFLQHDIQELLRLLSDNLEEKMKYTAVQGTMEKLFRGYSYNYIKAISVPFRSSREEAFYDISLTVKGVPSLVESFRKYCEVETLDGDNQYNTDQYGK